MTDHQHNWRLLSESFDRELSSEEQNLLEHFLAEHESPHEFSELFKRIRDSSTQLGSILKTDSSSNERLTDQKKAELQFLLESEMEKQQIPLSNRDVVFACELVSHGAIGLGELTEKITEWNSDSKSLSAFLKNESSIPDADFSKIESHVSDTIFMQALDQTLFDDVVAAIKKRVPEDDCTVFEDTSDDVVSVEFIKLLDRTNAGESNAFESLLDWLTNEARWVILQSRMFSHALRLKPVVDEVTLRLVGRKKLDQTQLACYYRNVGSVIRKLFQSDPELADSLLPSIGKRRVVVKQLVDALNQLADDEPRFVLMFNLRFFAGLTAQQVASLLELPEQDVSLECGYGIACLLQLINE